MNTNPEKSSNEIEANIQSGITRRTFIKRTSATVVVSILALNAFRNEALALEVGSGSTIMKKQKMWAKWTEKEAGTARAGNFGSQPAINPLPRDDSGIFTDLEKMLKDPNKLKKLFDLEEDSQDYNPTLQEPNTTGCVKVKTEPVDIRSGDHYDANGNVDGQWWELPNSPPPQGNTPHQKLTITYTYCIGFTDK